MRICDVSQFYSSFSGGVRRYISARQKFIDQGGTHEHVLIIPGARTERLRAGRSTIYTIKSPRVDRTSGYRALLNLSLLVKITRSEMPDIVESGDPYQLSWAVTQWSAKWNLATVGFYHSHFPEAYLAQVSKYGGRNVHSFLQRKARTYIKTLYSRFDRTLVPCPQLECELRRIGLSNTVTVKLGVDPELFHPAPRDEQFRAELNLSSKPCLLLSVGRLAREKNVMTLLEAFEILDQETPGRFHLHIVGDGPLRPRVLEMARKNGNLSWCRYYQDPAELARAYRAADLLVHPGVLETFGLVTVEAQACGLPVVGIQGTYMDRLAFSGLEHWAKENTPAALSEAIRAMVNKPLREIGQKASEAVLQEYTWRQVFTELFSIYEAVITEKTGSLRACKQAAGER